MPSPSLVEIMEEMAETLRAVYEPLATSDWPVQVEPRMNFNPTPPSIDIYPGDPFREQTSAGFGQEVGSIIFTVRARVSTADHEAGQDLLFALMDEEDEFSVATALMDDQTLNGRASSVFVEGPSGYTQYVDAGGQGSLLGCDWRVTLLRAYS